MAFKFNPFTGNLDVVSAASEAEILNGSFSAANNQTTSVNVTGLDLASIGGDAFDIRLIAKLDADTDDIIFYDLQVVNEGADYVIAQSQNKQNSLNIDFSVTALGQIQYVSDNYVGFVSLDFAWKIIKL